MPYQRLVGALQYLVTATRPDIANAVRFLASHTHDHTITHWHLAKRVVKYLKGTSSLGLTFGGRDASLDPVAYSDSDLAMDATDSTSIAGSVAFLGSGQATGDSTRWHDE